MGPPILAIALQHKFCYLKLVFGGIIWALKSFHANWLTVAFVHFDCNRNCICVCGLFFVCSLEQ